MANKFYDEERQVSKADGVTIIWQDITLSPDGARPETVLEMLLARVQDLNSILPCEENEHVIHHISEAISWEELRNRRRIAQEVHGQFLSHVSEDVK